MRVSVDEAWQDRGVAQINRLDREGVDDGQRCLAAPERPNAPAVNEDPPIAHGGRRNRKEPRSAVDDQWPVSRAFFSAALRAA